MHLKLYMHLLCLSHLRWNFVYQRPQHLLSRFAQVASVSFWEEPVRGAMRTALRLTQPSAALQVCVPHLAAGLSPEQESSEQRRLLNEHLREVNDSELILWYYTPAALSFTAHLRPRVTVYDCMDELSAFRGAPASLRHDEARLFRRADLVFTGGRSLYFSKRRQHPDVHLFPSSIDAAHFQQARTFRFELSDQQSIPHPRIGFAGVIDERLDTELLAVVAQLCPDWHFVMIGPMVKVSEADLPHAPNIHYLGQKKYEELPGYFAGWDVGMLPFARNEATRFISPTKTPEYLAAGLPVVSTSIADVVQAYGEQKLVEIANAPSEFVAACEKILGVKNNPAFLQRVDRALAQNSWDLTWQRMHSLVSTTLTVKGGRNLHSELADLRAAQIA